MCEAPPLRVGMTVCEITRAFRLFDLSSFRPFGLSPFRPFRSFVFSTFLQNYNTMKNNKSRHIILGLLGLITGIVMWSCDSEGDDARSKFIGRYEVEEYSLETYSSREDYEVNIIRDTGSQSLVIISNFYNYDVDIYARVDGNDIFVEEEVRNIFKFNGSGTLSGSVLTFEYTVRSVPDNNGEFDRLHAEMVRKD